MPDVHLADGFSITLSKAGPLEPWVAVSAVMSTDALRHRITFLKDKPISAVFCPVVADILTPILDGFRGRSGVHTDPDARLQMPGLAMRHLRVIHSNHGPGPARALARFSSFVGNPHRALLADDGFSYPMEALTSRVYRDALDWVLLPALNIVGLDNLSTFTEGDAAAMQSAMDTLRRSREKLMFQVELVKRELGRLEARSYTNPCLPRALCAAEPAQEEFRTLKVIREMD